MGLLFFYRIQSQTFSMKNILVTKQSIETKSSINLCTTWTIFDPMFDGKFANVCD